MLPDIVEKNLIVKRRGAVHVAFGSKTSLSPCPRHVRFTPDSDRILRRSEMTLSAMYGRRLRCKGKIWHFSEAFGCSHVFCLCMQALWVVGPLSFSGPGRKQKKRP